TLKQKQQKQEDVASQYNVSQATVSSIVKNSEKLKEKIYGGEVCAKMKRDSALLSWFKKARANNMPVSGNVLRLKAEDLQT
ncbi:hypothetical protein BaRGS_00023201, partial [Batillaria attramentaria]